MLPCSKDDAKSLNEIDDEIGLDITLLSLVERRLSSSLRALTKWDLSD
jgi:hypothetical protein